MKKNIITLAGIVLILLISIASVYANNSTNTTGDSTVFVDNPPISAQDFKNKLKTDITSYNDPTPISKEEALAIVTKIAPEYVAQSKNIHVVKQSMTNKNFNAFSPEALEKNKTLKEKGYLDNAPVWIISIEGLKIYRNGGPDLTNDQRKVGAHTEYNIVIDAITGAELYSFTYR